MTKIDLICDGCGAKISKERKEYNRRLRRGYSKFYCTTVCAGRHLDRPTRKYVPIVTKCLWCGVQFDSTDDPKGRRCCSRACAAKYSKSKCRSTSYDSTARKKISDAAKAAWARGVCNTSNVGKRRFNSVSEIELRKYLQVELPKYEFTTGLLCHSLGLSVDIWSRSKKVLVEYDGIWHFEDIKGQLKEKQRKDANLEAWCLKHGWRCIRIKETVYKKDVSGWQARIKDEIVDGTAKIVKYY